MAWSGWLILAAYACCYVWAFRISFRHFVAEFDDDEWGEIAADGCVSALVALFCPAFVIAGLLRLVVRTRDPEQFVRIVAGESRAAKTARRERDLRRREAEVARLERELGVK